MVTMYLEGGTMHEESKATAEWILSIFRLYSSFVAPDSAEGRADVEALKSYNPIDLVNETMIDKARDNYIKVIYSI